MNHENPSYESPASDGDRVILSSSGTVCTSYDSGGTCILDLDGEDFEVTVTKAFWDYETGWRFHGRAEGPIVEEFRRQATSGYTPAHYRKEYANAPELAADAERAFREFDPAKLYFSEFDLKPGPSLWMR
ncbi:hypothetical protein ACVIGB_000753 [Bradyrhizobium sp. USDA 4341]